MGTASPAARDLSLVFWLNHSSLLHLDPVLPVPSRVSSWVGACIPRMSFSLMTMTAPVNLFGSLFLPQIGKIPANAVASAKFAN